MQPIEPEEDDYWTRLMEEYERSIALLTPEDIAKLNEEAGPNAEEIPF